MPAKGQSEFKHVKAHTVYKDEKGKRVPGVTTILNTLAKPALIHWSWDLGMQGIDYRKYRDKAANIGTLAHYLVESDLKGEEPELEGYSKEEIDWAENCLISYYYWKQDKDLQPQHVEIPLVSKLGFGGTIDCYGLLNDTLCLIDLKTGKAIYNEMILQLAAYAHLLEEHNMPVEQVRILKIGRKQDEGFEERILRPDELQPHWRIFKACLEIYQTQKLIK